jgi:hypothetical protein
MSPSMKKIIFFILTAFTINVSFSQKVKTDTSENGNAIIHQDERIAILGEKMVEYNENLSKKTRLVMGYRLMVLNTNDRDYAMKIRSTLLKQFPDQKIYMIFLSPYIKIKFGNFIDKDEAEKMKKTLKDLKIITGNIYLLNEKVELKPQNSTSVNKED